MLLTIQQFADKHGVDKKTIEYRMRNGMPFERHFGKRLIDSKTKFKKDTRGAKSAKRATKK